MAGSRRRVEAVLSAARPQALAALTRYFRDLDPAEDAFQEACLRALGSWPEKGLPRDPVAWLILVGRNVGVDQSRRSRRFVGMPPELPIVESEDAEKELVEQLEEEAYRDDVLRLLFICCHPELPVAQQIALALKIVVGLSVEQIARAFLVGPTAMEKRLTRAKQRVAQAAVPFSTPSRDERAKRLRTVAMMVYLLFNEGYSASGPEARERGALCVEAIRLARLLLRLFPRECEIMGLLALCLLHHARRPARLDEDGGIIQLEDQDRDCWEQRWIAEGEVLVEKALRRRRPGPLQVQAAIAAVHSRAATAPTTDWHEIDRLYAILELIEPSPVVSLNRAVAVAKTRGTADALAMIEPLADALAGYFHFHGVRGALLADLGRSAAARTSLERARELARTPAESALIRGRLAGLSD